ncbi:restriction endonuclease subunit S [Leptospira bouyouniensis]|uniref:Restriction endonuclease subunit S n=1 Tax=Leptospira bouyouniensis TaxID=2484911 RepID=A0ABY2L7Y8_9LEPT|nr:restriction endonuclease subunit S [Leptospira bouyouniensis]TGK52765.1 restriction endonuclease subunit S [Leptospira bouyouniensis]
MSEWIECKLGEIAFFSQGLQVPIEEQFTEQKENLIRFIRIKDITSNGQEPIRYIMNPGDRYIARFGDLIMIRYGTPGLLSDKYEGVIANNLFKINLKNETECYRKYIFYFLNQQSIQDHFMASQNSTTMPAITFTEVSSLPILLPPIAEQKAIAGVLSALDDKIDLMHRQNKTLEAMAEALFRQWFVEEAEESWEEGKLGDLVEIKYGKDHKSLLDGNVPVFGSGGIMRYADRSLYNFESVLIPRKGSLDNVIYINEPFWSVDTMFYTIMRKPNIAKFIYQFVKNLNLSSMNVGSAVPSMTTEILNNVPIQIPSDQLFEIFEERCSQLYLKIQSNAVQIRSLEKLRDTLLPKLMIGEVRVDV